MYGQLWSAMAAIAYRGTMAMVAEKCGMAEDATGRQIADGEWRFVAKLPHHSAMAKPPYYLITLLQTHPKTLFLCH